MKPFLENENPCTEAFVLSNQFWHKCLNWIIFLETFSLPPHAASHSAAAGTGVVSTASASADGGDVVAGASAASLMSPAVNHSKR